MGHHQEVATLSESPEPLIPGNAYPSAFNSSSMAVISDWA